VHVCVVRASSVSIVGIVLCVCVNDSYYVYDTVCIFMTHTVYIILCVYIKDSFYVYDIVCVNL